jgi:hypothetical protein
MALIDPPTRRWLVSEYNVPDPVEEKTVPRAQKHALIVRVCKCGRKIAGNVYFRHIRHCREEALVSTLGAELHKNVCNPQAPASVA